MRILALEVELPGASVSGYRKHGEAEAQKVWELQQAEFIQDCWFNRDAESAVFMLEADNVLEAEQRLRELPFVAHGLIRFDLVPLRPYPGFSRLFAGGHMHDRE